ncbi:MAG: SdrD B-like domain-containing protein [Anaerolineae bacterium]|jgi:hypothetical protein
MMTRLKLTTAFVVTLSLLALTLLGVVVVSAQQPTGSISGVVYCDANHNYVYEPGEEVAGVTVTLYDDDTCDYVPDTPALATQDSASDGTYSFTGLEVGVDSPSRECYFVGVDDAAPELGTCNYIDWNPRDVPLYGTNVDVTQDLGFQQVWEKLVNGQPWVPGLTVTAETSDTIEVVDTVILPFREPSQDERQQLPEWFLVESWNPDELALIDVELDSFTSVISSSGLLTWTIPLYQTPVPTATITKTFHVEPCTWTSTTVQEDLYEFWIEVPPQQIDARPFVVQKTPPVLTIDSTYNPEVTPGEQASFSLDYGNSGGYENDVMIRNDFPAEAPFVSAVPAPDREDAGGAWVEWDVGDLGNGDSGSIDVTVAIQAGLPHSTTMVITDVIYNHVDEIADSTTITFHVNQPPQSLGNFVWYDTDQDGIQDAGEPGVGGIDVSLHPRQCSEQQLASDVTDDNGNYLFTDVPPGVYCLQFSSIPAGWSISPQNQGADDTVDSDADPVTAQITDITLTDTDLTQDMGLFTNGSIGDTVWCDANGNGAYDAGEGIAGVSIRLYDDPACSAAAGSLLATQATTGDGQYLFVGLPAGPLGDPLCYYVAVDAANLGTCDQPITPLSYPVPLDAGNPDSPDNDFGFQEPTVPPPVVPEASTLILLGGATTTLAGYIGLQLRARRRKPDHE